MLRLLRLRRALSFMAVGFGPPSHRRTMVIAITDEKLPRPVRSDFRKTAADAQHTIEALGDAKEVRLSVGDHAGIPLPESVVHMLVAALKEFAKGRQVSVVGADAEMTTQQAADLLLVSRPYLISLLNAGKIPYRKVGTKRRILAEDVQAYKATERVRQRKLLDELAAESQELGLD
jgi:excisionase family DNA binding protein